MDDRRTPKVLALLFETVDDARIFGLDFIGDKERFRRECREIFEHLYSNAVRRWNRMLDPARGGADPEHPGVLLFERFQQLTTCWIETFEHGIREVARRRDLPEPDDRDFLYFMLGYLQCGAEEAVRRHWEVRETGALKAPRPDVGLWWMDGVGTPEDTEEDQSPSSPRPEAGLWWMHRNETPAGAGEDRSTSSPQPETEPWWLDRNGTPGDAEEDDPPF